MKTKKEGKEPGFGEPFHSNTTAVSKLAFDQMVAQLRALSFLTWKGKKITKEAYLNAVWLWMEELGVDEVEKGIAKHLERLENIIGSAVDSGSPSESQADAGPLPG